MINGIDKQFTFQSQALLLRAQRQQVLAANIANADTPGYKAVDFNFAQALEHATQPAAGTRTPLAQSAAGHLPAGAPAALPTVALAARAPSSPTSGAALDGNTVDMDTERVQFADNALRYEAALRFLNGKIRTLLSAIQG